MSVLTDPESTVCAVVVTTGSGSASLPVVNRDGISHVVTMGSYLVSNPLEMPVTPEVAVTTGNDKVEVPTSVDVEDRSSSLAEPVSSDGTILTTSVASILVVSVAVMVGAMDDTTGNVELLTLTISVTTGSVIFHTVDRILQSSPHRGYNPVLARGALSWGSPLGRTCNQRLGRDLVVSRFGTALSNSRPTTDHTPSNHNPDHMQGTEVGTSHG